MRRDGIGQVGAQEWLNRVPSLPDMFRTVKLTDCKAGDHHVKQQIQPVYFSHCRSNDIASELSLDDSWPGHVVQPTSVPEGHPGTAITCEVREEGQ